MSPLCSGLEAELTFKGDIGETPGQVQNSLQAAFTLAYRWGCVLLLDEADVFLAERNRTDMNRNAVVSVFLRNLEYYNGILFLTFVITTQEICST